MATVSIRASGTADHAALAKTRGPEGRTATGFGVPVIEVTTLGGREVQLGGLYLELSRDVSEGRQAEYLIRQVFERAPDGVAIVGRDYRFQRVNRVYERSWKLPAEAIVGRHVADCLGQTLFEERVKGELDRCFAGEHVRYAEWFETSDGRRFLSVSFSPLRLDSERVEAALTIIRDLTDHMRAVESLQAAQTELAHATRVMTLGELAASIAHEVNQPLAAVVADATASLNWLASVPPDLDRVRDALDAIVTDAHRAAEVIQRIRQLATKSLPRKDPLDVNGIVRDVDPLVRAELRRHEVALELDLAPGLPAILGDRVQLQQVLLNLMVNGIEAMATVTNRPRELLIRSALHEKAQVLMAVQDTGVGIDPNGVDRLFSAFFTTKLGGMGMGLSISRSIVEAHGGRLWATPNEPHGAIFQFSLPVGPPPAPASIAPGQPASRD
jgi:PAS domain S-box-containing protein